MPTVPYFTLALLLYVTLDFGNPLMPGAVSFDPSESVEAMQGGGARAPHDMVPAPAVEPSRIDVPAEPAPPSRRRLLQAQHFKQQVSAPRLTYARPADPVRSPDDH